MLFTYIPNFSKFNNNDSLRQFFEIVENKCVYLIYTKKSIINPFKCFINNRFKK